MRNKKNSFLKTLLFFFLGFHSFLSNAQSGCENADFELANFQNWSGETGLVTSSVCCAINNTSNQSPATNGIIPGRHTIMTGTGTDPYTCGQLPVVAPGGGTFSVRLGNDVSAGHTYPDAECERLRYVYNISSQTSLIIYKYAVVLENPPHTEADQPRFEARLLDQNGNIIPCTEYIVVASTGNPAFFTCPSTGINYSPWKTVGVDVSSYVGQNVTLEFATGDCAQGGHFGYAYVEAGCAPFALDTRYCLNVLGLPSATIEAPSGFDGYLWTSNGQTLGTQSAITIFNPAQGQVVNCQITSFNGCVANLQSTLTPSNVDASFTSNPVCVGNSNGIVNTTTYVNAVLDSIHWSSSDGFTSTSPTFDHEFTTPGTYSVTMFVMSDAGCYDQVTQQVVVNPGPVSSFNLTDICLGQTAQLVSQSTLATGTLVDTWIINGTDTLIGSPQTYNFSNADTVNVQLIASSPTSTCRDTSEQQIIIYNSPIADFTFAEQCISNALTFTNTSDYLDNVSFAWSYNSNIVSSDTNYTSLFSTPGINSILLSISDAHSEVTCSDTTSHTFFVHPYPIIALSGIPDPCVGSTSNLVISNGTTISSSENLIYHWVVNGVTSGNTANLSYPVPADGNYTFTLTASSDFGCSSDSTFTVAVYQEPVADFSFVEQCFPNPIYFSSTSTVSDSTAYSWILNNSVVSNSDNYMANLSSAGSYTMSLVVSETHHEITCDDTLTKNFTVHGIPDLGFTNTAQPCVGLPITSYNLSSVTPIENVSYVWSVDGVTWSTFYDFSYTFPASGSYTINLAATSDFGCVNDTTFIIEVYPIPQPPVLNASIPVCPGDDITFSATAEPNSTIQWSGPNNFNSQNFVVTMPFNMSDIGIYSAYITSQYGCVSGPTSVPTSILNIYSFDDFEFPNVITANGDGINDTLDINNYFKTCDEYTLYIFNRWGNLVHEQTKGSSQFTGETENNKELVEGVYFYKMVINAIDGDQIKSGFIHVVKQ